MSCIVSEDAWRPSPPTIIHNSYIIGVYMGDIPYILLMRYQVRIQVRAGIRTFQQGSGLVMVTQCLWYKVPSLFTTHVFSSILCYKRENEFHVQVSYQHLRPQGIFRTSEVKTSFIIATKLDAFLLPSDVGDDRLIVFLSFSKILRFTFYVSGFKYFIGVF